MNQTRRSFLHAAAAAAAAATLTEPVLAAAGVFTPEQFGAKGDGVSNDSGAFAKLAAAVNAAGGGTVELRKTTYIVGEQRPNLDPNGQFYFVPVPLLGFAGCTRPLVIRGNGATMRCAPGLRYGTFDLAGRPARHPMPYIGPGLASPYLHMLKVENCSGRIEISDLELDGNLPHLVIGGEYGDTGRQIPGSGIGLLNNRGDEVLSNVYSHHHPLDGVIIDGIDRLVKPAPQRLLRGLRSEYNARQGVSLIGGRGYAFEQCKFNHTGHSVIQSAPGAGVDIEAEGGKINRDHSFTDCEFVDNHGSGMVADTGDSEGATFTRCTFVGTVSWCAWPNKPRFRFHACRFVGSLVHAYGEADAARSTQFYDCTFLDDPKLSPTGKVYVGDKPEGPIADLPENPNVLFSRCTFRLTHKGLLPWSWYVIYADCRMDQRSNTLAFPKGKYLGTSVLNGHVDMYGANIVGVLMLNGTRIERRKLGG
ncbi:MAG TPA: hypothetical protein VGD66_07190 [Allosphingosinicella sp.]|jgi:hypothetical protein